MPSQMLYMELDQTYWALAFVCFSFFLLYIFVLGYMLD